jgi:asparagine synthase (glutamine-hydrolysing)
MCGICGMYNLDRHRPVDESVVRTMTAQLSHRGPDEDGFHVDGSLALGMRRLSIIDLHEGQQPISNEDGRIHVVLNGEIYNYRELRRTLVAKGHTFRTNSDTEAIVHAYEEYGERCVNHLNGMFAFAIWDEPQRLLMVARDRLGIKPLYYYFKNGQFGFCSELKPLLGAPAVDRCLDPRAVDALLHFDYVPTPLSIVKDVQKLPAGHLLTLGEKGLQLRQYWDVDYSRNGLHDPAEIEDGLMQRLTTAVSRQMVSDVPLGAFLSGGIDSSLIVALMCQQSSRPIKTFSIGFSDAGFDELKYARIVAKHFQTEHHERIVKASNTTLILEAIEALDEPLADDSIVPTLLVSRLARGQVKVVLSGDGGDELFAGYDRYQADKLANWYAMLPAGWRTGVLEPLMDHVPQTTKRLGLVNIVKGVQTGARQPEWLGHARWLTYLGPSQRQQLYAPALLQALNGHDAYWHLRSRLGSENGRDRLSRQLYTDLKSYLVDDVLTKVDRMSMAASLEVRPPLLDHELVEYVARIPSHLKLRAFTSKHILKQAASRLLPPSIVHRRKSGFSMPVKNWLRRDLKPLLMDTLDGLDRQGLFNAPHIRTLVAEHEAMRANHSHTLWALLVLGVWSKGNLS